MGKVKARKRRRWQVYGKDNGFKRSFEKKRSEKKRAGPRLLRRIDGDDGTYSSNTGRATNPSGQYLRYLGTYLSHLHRGCQLLNCIHYKSVGGFLNYRLHPGTYCGRVIIGNPTWMSDRKARTLKDSRGGTECSQPYVGGRE